MSLSTNLLVLLSNIVGLHGAEAQKRPERPLGIDKRLRAVTAFCLHRRDLPASALCRIVANTYDTGDSFGEKSVANGFFPVPSNEWKALKFAFRGSQRTEALFSIIDRYESTITALQGENDGPITRIPYGGLVELSLGTDRFDRAIIMIHQDGYISELILCGLQSEDVSNVSYLPKQMKRIVFRDGPLMYIDFTELSSLSGLNYLAQAKGFYVGVRRD